MIVKNNNFNFILDNLDETQYKAVTSEDNNIVIIAPAGSGKTTALTTAIAKYRYDNLNDHICAITFTIAAKNEMLARLKQMGVYDVEISTIHSWARQQLEQLGRKYHMSLTVMQEEEIKGILSLLINSYGKSHNNRTVNLEILYQYITSSHRMDISDSYRRTLDAIELQYQSYKKRKKVYDFTDYPQFLYDMLVEFNESITNIDALFVDEFQDVDTVQLQVFDKTYCRKKFFIGDPWQSIYQFRDADGRAFEKLKNFKVYHLNYNYRSYQEILDFATSVYTTQLYSHDFHRNDGLMDQSITSIQPYQIKSTKIQCTRGNGGQVIVIDNWDNIIQYDSTGAQYINDEISAEEIFKNMLQDNPQFLCRFNKQVKAISNSTFYSATTIHQAKGLEYSSVIVVDMGTMTKEELNVAYVALTRAKNRVLIIPWGYIVDFLKLKCDNYNWRKVYGNI